MPIMANKVKFRYTRGIASLEFSRTLVQRIDAYFSNRGISRNANAEMYAKTILGFSMWIGSYVFMMTGQFSAVDIVGVYVVHGLAQLYMAFNIAHDANHGAYSRNKRVNRVLSCVFDLVGV